MTKGDFAESAVKTGRISPGVAFDYALPSGWLDTTVGRLEREYPHMDRVELWDFLLFWFVWAYPPRSIFGEPVYIGDYHRVPEPGIVERIMGYR